MIYDIFVGQRVEEIKDIDEYAEVKEFQAKSREQRWEYFTTEMEKCIRCYACRNSCPLCYCEECFLDSSQPQWVGKTTELTDVQVSHLGQAFCKAGRCVDCGACERACPMGVDFRKLLQKLGQDVAELYHYQAGINIEEPAPLTTFDLNDPQDFIR